LDEQQRQRKRNQLNELSNEFNSLAIRTHESYILEYSKQDDRDFVHDISKAIIKLKSFPHKELVFLLYSKHPSILAYNFDLEDFNNKLQPIIQELINDTYDPNFSMKTALSAENLDIDPIEYQNFLEDLSWREYT
jgi:hypothetical protein